MNKPANNKLRVIRLGAKELRVSEPTARDISKIKRREIYIICDNILDTYNIGSIFRLADAVAAKCVYLCGETETPPNIKIHRAAVGTDKWVPWQYFATAKEAIEELRRSYAHLRGVRGGRLAHLGAESGLKVVAIEQSKKSVDFRKVEFREPIAFVVGHETSGVSRETLKVCDEIVEIPMYGVNVSLNVMVSLTIVLYRVI